MLYLSIAATLFVMIASLNLLAKVKQEALGSLFKWTGYLILLVSSLVLICQLAQGFQRMCCREKGCGMEKVMIREMECGPRHMGECREENMEGCKRMGGGSCREEEMEHHCGGGHEEGMHCAGKDSADNK